MQLAAWKLIWACNILRDFGLEAIVREVLLNPSRVVKKYRVIKQQNFHKKNKVSS